MAMGIEVTWKPMLWFTNGSLGPRRTIVDGVSSGKRCKDLHPWQQDLDYAVYGIKSLSDPGDTVLDPFMGSGTTGEACQQLGRNFIGIEIDPTYFKIAKARPQRARAEAV